MTEDELRELAGLGREPVITFMGETFTVRADGLAALLRYAASGQTPEPGSDAVLAAMHRLLEDCVEDFGAFSALAFTAKADIGDVTGAAEALIAHYCVRNHWPAIRLVGYVASNLEEMDGRLLRAGGRGLASLSAREACNLALAECLDGRDEDDRETFLEDLNYEGDSSSEALQLVRQMQAAQKEAAGG